MPGPVGSIVDLAGSQGDGCDVQRLAFNQLQVAFGVFVIVEFSLLATSKVAYVTVELPGSLDI